MRSYLLLKDRKVTNNKKFFIVKIQYKPILLHTYIVLKILYFKTTII